jgi:hypothetical protein
MWRLRRDPGREAVAVRHDHFGIGDGGLDITGRQHQLIGGLVAGSSS